MVIRKGISLALPYYKGRKFIARSLVSAYEDLSIDDEIILINDGCPEDRDDIYLLLRELETQLGPAIHYHEINTNRGLVFALNTALDVACGTYFARLDQDDVVIPGRFDIQRSALLAGTAEVSFGRWVIDCPLTGRAASFGRDINDRGNQIRLRFGNILCHGTFCGKTSLIRSMGGYRVQYQYAEDYDLWLRLMNNRVKFHFSSTPLIIRGVHPEQMSKRFWRQSYARLMATFSNIL